MPTDDELIDESMWGSGARRDGEPRSACPHPKGTSLGNAWLRGWDTKDQLSNLHPTMAGVLAPFVGAAE